MQRILTCLTSEHDWRLVVLAGIICFMASLAAINLFGRARATSGRARNTWLAVAGATTGCGIWATHFIAMLAYEPGVATTYDIGLTALSLVAAAMVTLAGLGFAVLGPAPYGAPVGGGIVGAGVACMHYTGMWALQVPGHVTWQPDLVIASIVVGVLLGVAALVVAVRGNDIRATAAAALLLTLAIVSHHFTAMGAIGIIPDAKQLLAGLSVAPGGLSIGVAGATVAVVAMSLAGAWADHRVASHAAEGAAQFRALTEATQDAIAICEDGIIVEANSNLERLVGLTASAFRGRPLSSLLQKGDAAAIGVDPIEVVVGGAGGKPIECEASARSIPHGNGARTIVSLRDLRERKRVEARLHYLVHDPVTELPNRTLLDERLVQALSQTAAAGGDFAVLRMDLVLLKQDNQPAAERPSDAALREVSGRLSAATEGAFIARIGASSFALIATGGPQPTTAAALADRLLAVVEEIVGEGRLKLRASIGIAIHPQDGADAASLLANAAASAGRAKTDGMSPIRWFEAGMDERLRERRALLHDLRLALGRGEIKLQYEPQTFTSGEVAGFQTQMSWQDPSRGAVPPETFMPVAEEGGLTTTISAWTLREACREAASWPQEHQIAVALSPTQFRVDDLPGLVQAALRESGLAARRLELGIPEDVLAEDFSRAISILRQLKSLGVRFARARYH